MFNTSNIDEYFYLNKISDCTRYSFYFLLLSYYKYYGDRYTIQIYGDITVDRIESVSVGLWC